MVQCRQYRIVAYQYIIPDPYTSLILKPASGIDEHILSEMDILTAIRVKRRDKQYYIQVAYSVTEEKAYEREFGAFAKLDNSCQKIVITNDDIDYSTSTVRHIRFKDFVFMNEL